MHCDIILRSMHAIHVDRNFMVSKAYGLAKAHGSQPDTCCVMCMQKHHVACIVGSISQPAASWSHDAIFLTTKSNVCMGKQKLAQRLNLYMDGFA